jgi:hypothetical protein
MEIISGTRRHVVWWEQMTFSEGRTIKFSGLRSRPCKESSGSVFLCRNMFNMNQKYVENNKLHEHNTRKEYRIMFEYNHLI